MKQWTNKLMILLLSMILIFGVLSIGTAALEPEDVATAPAPETDNEPYMGEHCPDHNEKPIPAPDKAPTCTEDGYRDCTVCPVCGKVVDPGIRIPAFGHLYMEVDGVLTCLECGEKFEGQLGDEYYIDGVVAHGWYHQHTHYYDHGVMYRDGAYYIDGMACVFDENGLYDPDARYTGLLWNGEDLYSFRDGEKQHGWVTVGEDIYFFRWESYEAVREGPIAIDGHNYVFRDYKLYEGEWVYKDHGLCYIWGGNWVRNQWFDLHGDLYYFRDRYACTGITALPLDGNPSEKGIFIFNETGVFQKDLNGFELIAGQLYYCINGVAANSGLTEIDGGYYFFTESGKALRDGQFDLPEERMNGLLPGGLYDFDADGKMVVQDGLIEKDGELYYYENNRMVDKGLVRIGDDYYFFGVKYHALRNGKFELPEEKMNGLLPGGIYEFTEDGKMILLNGVIFENGHLYYYENSRRVAKGLVQTENGYYFFGLKYYAISNGRFELSEDMMNGLLPGGIYEFDEVGRLILLNGIVHEKDAIYYYENSQKIAKGLVQDGEDFYFFGETGKALKNGKFDLPEEKMNGLLPGGVYVFDENGKMIRKSGIIEEGGQLYYYENGQKVAKGLVKDGEDYYYFGLRFRAVRGGKFELPEEKMNGLLSGGIYEFTEDGRMILKSGVVRENGQIYFYENGQKVPKGLVKDGEDYYYFGLKCRAVKNGKFELPEEKMNGLFAGGIYEFDAEGRMIVKEGIVFENGSLYYYEKGQKVAKGLVKTEEGYFFFGLKYRAVKNGKFELPEEKMNGLFPGGVYRFDEVGRMILLNGIVFEDGELYYYEDNCRVAKGLVQVNEDYYFFGSKLHALRNGVYELEEASMNGLLPGGFYQFDDAGKIVFRTGIFCEFGELYYYENGQRVEKGLVKDGEHYYFFGSKLRAVKNGVFELPEEKMNGLLPAGAYEFDENGHMILLNGIVFEDGELYYYENNERIAKGLVKTEEGYFYFGLKFRAVKNGEFELPEEKMNGLLPAGVYRFDELGRMILLNGVVFENGELYYYVDNQRVAQGLVKTEQGYFFFGPDFYAVKDGSYELSEQDTNGLLPAGVYEFDKVGKMLLKNGILMEDGELYYYVDNQRVAKGLVLDGDTYYYFGSQYKALKDGKFYLPEEGMNGLLPGGIYEFDAEGRMIRS